MRYAIYFTPPQSDPLAAAAAAWLGRDAFTDAHLERPQLPGVAPGEAEALTTEPARYGFHGTLVAPFYLRPDCGVDDLVRAADTFAQARPAFVIPRLVVRRLGRFIALVPDEPVAAVKSLAAAAVDHFDALRAPLAEADIARRQPDRLSARQRTYLLRYGYPYVKDEFRFHMTLTGPVRDDDIDRVTAAIETAFAPFLSAPVSVEAIAIFAEPAHQAPFTVTSMHRLSCSELQRSA